MADDEQPKGFAATIKAWLGGAEVREEPTAELLAFDDGGDESEARDLFFVDPE